MLAAARAQGIVVPALSVLSALALGAAVIAASGGDVVKAYTGLWEGSLGRPRSVADTLIWATPYIFGGLAVALAFKAGLFNIGVEGQIAVGALASVFVGYAVHGIPWPLHLLLALAAGALAGAAWAGIAGYLKAATGAHEVITTIMLNYIAIQMTSFLVAGPMKDRDPLVAVAQTPEILESAELPALFAGTRLHWGFVLAVVLAFGVYWLLFRTTIGFRIRTVGANPNAARYAGMGVGGTLVLTMALSGMLAGMAGAVEVVGLNHYHTAGFSVGYGFDAIAVALLARTHPIGVLPAAFLFGALRAGATRMQFLSQIPIDVIYLIQALVLLFVAAPSIVRWLYRLKEPLPPLAPVAVPEAEADGQLAPSWSKRE